MKYKILYSFAIVISSILVILIILLNKFYPNTEGVGYYINMFAPIGIAVVSGWIGMVFYIQNMEKQNITNIYIQSLNMDPKLEIVVEPDKDFKTCKITMKNIGNGLAEFVEVYERKVLDNGEETLEHIDLIFTNQVKSSFSLPKDDTMSIEEILKDGVRTEFPMTSFIVLYKNYCNTILHFYSFELILENNFEVTEFTTINPKECNKELKKEINKIANIYIEKMSMQNHIYKKKEFEKFMKAGENDRRTD